MCVIPPIPPIRPIPPIPVPWKRNAAKESFIPPADFRMMACKCIADD